MKLVFLMGGDGNRLFQISHAVSMRETGFEVELIQLAGYIERIASFFGWSYHESWIGLEEISKSLGFRLRNASFLETLWIMSVYLIRKLVGQQCGFDPLLNEVANRSKIRIGYFQTSEHQHKVALNKVADIVSSKLGIIPNENSVIHIRGGDFDLKSRLSTGYVLEVIDCNPNIVVVTNDNTYVKELAKDRELNLSESKSAITDFITIASAKRIYPSNSTFAFWAAYVAKRNGGFVYTCGDHKLWNLL